MNVLQTPIIPGRILAHQLPAIVIFSSRQTLDEKPGLPAQGPVHHQQIISIKILNRYFFSVINRDLQNIILQIYNYLLLAMTTFNLVICSGTSHEFLSTYRTADPKFWLSVVLPHQRLNAHFHTLITKRILLSPPVISYNGFIFLSSFCL